MIYGETKIYHDGSHYVGISYKPRPVSRKRPKIDEKIVVKHKSGAEKEKAPSERTMTRKELFGNSYKQHIRGRLGFFRVCFMKLVVACAWLRRSTATATCIKTSTRHDLKLVLECDLKKRFYLLNLFPKFVT